MTTTLAAMFLAVTVGQAQTPAALMYDANVGPVAFAAGEVKTALTANHFSVTALPPGDPALAKPSIRVIITTEDARLPGQPATTGLVNQGYSIQRIATPAATNWWVIGKGAAGAMYGGLELAEAVQLADGLSGVTNRQTNPYLQKRGIKFN